MEKRSQSALEYTMTYGWALLIIVIVLAVLYSFGIFSPTSTAVPNVYVGLSGFQVTFQQCVSNFGFFVQLSNQLGSYIKITGVNVTLANGTQVGSLPLDLPVAPLGEQLFAIPGGCPFVTNMHYEVILKISYKVTSPITGSGVSMGTFTGVTATGPNNFVSSLISNSFAFGTSNGNLSVTSEYYSTATLLGKFASPFPSNLSDLGSAFINCGSPDDSQGYTAVTDMYFSSSVSFKTETNDATQIFFKNSNGGSWQYVFNYSGTPDNLYSGGSGPWAGNSNSFFSNSFNVTPGEYEVAVDWSNICGGGISAVSINGVLAKANRWNVTVWVPQNGSVYVLPYSYVNASPTLPLHVSVEQTGFWNSSSTANSCGTNQLCTTILNDFGMPAGYPWWAEYDGINVSSTKSVAYFITPPGNYSYSLKPFKTESRFCELYYNGNPLSGYLSAGQSTSYTTTSITENCSVVFNATGLPTLNDWNVTLNGHNKTASSRANVTFYPSGSFSSFKARKVTIGTNTYYPCPTSGNISLGSYVKINYSTSSSSCSSPDYLISTIYETNLPQFLNWSADYDGIIKFSNITQAVSFLTPAGNYSFNIKPIIVDYHTTGCVGNISANTSAGYIVAGRARTISFSQELNCSTTFNEYGLPQGISDWNITYNLSTHSSAIHSNISFYANTTAPNDAGEDISLPTPGYGTFKAYNQMLSNGTKYYPCPASGEISSGFEETIIYSTSSCPYS